MKVALIKSVVVSAALLLTPATTYPDHLAASQVPSRADDRASRLKMFFQKNGCPIADLAGDFITAADQHGLDWRLLPSISMIESSGGKRYLNNNIFGWDSCRVGFASIREGIHHVASRLAHSKHYKNKDLDEILSAYNPHDTYPPQIKYLMRMLGPAELPAEVSRD